MEQQAHGVDDLFSLVREYGGRVLSLNDFINVLKDIGVRIRNSWSVVRDSVVKDVKLSALGVKMNITNLSMRPIVNIDHKLPNDKTKYLLTGFLISDASLIRYRSAKSFDNYMFSINSPDPHLISSFILTLANYLGLDKIKNYVYIAVAEGKHDISVSFRVIVHVNSDNKVHVRDLAVSKDTILYILSNYSSILSDDLRVWLRGALDGWDGGGWVRVRKQVRFVYYALRGLVGRDSVFTWYLGDGVRGHFERGGFDIGFSMVFDGPVIRFANEYLAGLYGFGGAFFGGSGARGSEYYVRCPVKALVIEDIRRWAEAWPRELLTDRVLGLLKALKYGKPCLSYRRWPTIDIDGFELILRKHNMGRGWYLTKSSSDLKLLEAIANRLRELGVSPSIERSSGGYTLYVPIEDTKRILRGLGLYERFYGEPRKLPSIDDVINVLRKFSIRRWHVHVGRERNSRGYEYEVKCLLISLGDSTGAKTLKEELTALGIRVRKVVWGTVIICNQEDRDLTLRALELLSNSEL